jgi:hypothetical protein
VYKLSFRTYLKILSALDTLAASRNIKSGFQASFFSSRETHMARRPKTPPIKPESPYTDADGAAAFLLVAPQTLANWRITGEGPPFSKVGHRILYSIADLTAFVAERKVNSTSELEYRGKTRGRPPKAASAASAPAAN